LGKSSRQRTLAEKDFYSESVNEKEGGE